MAHAWHDVLIGENAPREFTAVIVIHLGTKLKYEIDKETGLLHVNRVLYSAMYYPANYGFIPQTLGEDGDALDVLVLMQEAPAPLSVVHARPIGVLDMYDAGESDEKILCVCLDDPEFNEYEHIDNLPKHRLAELQAFFQDYKKLEGKSPDVGDYSGPAEAVKMVQRGMKAYKKKWPKGWKG